MIAAILKAAVITMVLWHMVYATGQLRTRVCVSGQQMQEICGTSKVKLIFVNDSTLYYVDFSQTTPQVIALALIQGGIAPVISPDGSKVTYAVATGNLEFNTTNSAAWLCDLSATGTPVKIAEPAFVPRFVKNSSTTMMIYSTCGKKSAGKNYIWDGCGKTVMRDVQSAVAGPEQVVWGGGSFNGGLSWDNRYLSTAESSEGAFVLDLQGQMRPDMLHSFPVKNTISGKDTTISCQVCNLSSSPSRLFPRAVMYLDFSSSAFTSANCNTPDGLGTWGMHTRIFLSSNPGKTIRWYDLPTESVVPIADAKGIGEVVEKEWDYSEWSNHPYFGVTTVAVDRIWFSTEWDHTFNNEQIYCINLKDSTYHKILETADSSKTSETNMQWPWLWIDTPADFNEDSRWLFSETAVRHSLTGKNNDRRITFNGRIIKSVQALTNVSVYSLLGRQVYSVRPPLSSLHSIDLGNTRLHNGIYGVRVTTVDGSCRSFRYIRE